MGTPERNHLSRVRAAPPARGERPAPAALLAVLVATVLPAAVAAPSPAAAQVPPLPAPPLEDARLPSPGEVWLEVSPQFQTWERRFSAEDAAADVPGKLPLFSDYDGSIASRLYPGPAPLLSEVNEGATALGYGPLTEDDLSLGSLEFGNMVARRTAVPLRARAGLLDRLSLDLSLTLVKTEMEASFLYDSAAATVAPAGVALADPSAFLSDLAAARAGLQSVVDADTLAADRDAAARALLERSGEFVAALEQKVGAGALLPLDGSPAGASMVELVAGFQQSFAGFGLETPALPLAGVATSSSLRDFFTGPIVEAGALEPVSRGLQPAEVEAGLRLLLLDTFREPGRRRPGREAGGGGPPVYPDTLRVVPPRADTGAVLRRDTAAAADTAARPTGTTVADTASAGAESAAVDTAAADSTALAGERASPSGSGGEETAGARPGARAEVEDGDGGLQLRTSVGLGIRLPLGDMDRPPYFTPSSFLDVPAGDGSRDVEVALYQDVRYGKLLVHGVVRYGVQTADELVLRVHPPDRPFALAVTEVPVRRDLGDYLRVRIAPHVRVNPSVSLGLEYALWRKGADAYEVDPGGPAGDPVPGRPVSGEPLETGTAGTRHHLGIGIHYRAASESVPAGSRPVEAGFTYLLAPFGSGVQTAATRVVSFQLRVPVGIF